MLKRFRQPPSRRISPQPPSGGCVLKLGNVDATIIYTPPAAFGRLCVETLALLPLFFLILPAAFGRLCVETACWFTGTRFLPFQPPSGGCVLKQIQCGLQKQPAFPAAFGRLCVETLKLKIMALRFSAQPPSGGCVLKRRPNHRNPKPRKPAAFGRLCVETSPVQSILASAHPAAFGRLCVETSRNRYKPYRQFPAAFGRLCVETNSALMASSIGYAQPPSGGCVLKLNLFLVIV